MNLHVRERSIFESDISITINYNLQCITEFAILNIRQIKICSVHSLFYHRVLSYTIYFKTVIVRTILSTLIHLFVIFL
jgi:hypothetical protein